MKLKECGDRKEPVATLSALQLTGRMEMKERVPQEWGLKYHAQPDPKGKPRVGYLMVRW